MNDNKMITISLPLEYIRLIDIVSKFDDLSRAQLIRRIIKEYIIAKDYSRKFPLSSNHIKKPTEYKNLPSGSYEDVYGKKS
jgi:hypothetical protein